MWIEKNRYRRKSFDASPDSDGLIRKASHMAIDLKEVGADGTITGYGSKWDFVDSYGEAVKKGAFTDSLKQWDGQPIPMLWQHMSALPVGVWTDYSEDNVGLKLRGKMNLDTQRGKEAYSDVKTGAVKGLSIGYYELVVDSWEEARKNNVRNLYKLDLREVSTVTFPALREAQIDAIKAARAAGNLPSLREFEEALREKLLLSRADARFVAERGFKALIVRDSDRAPRSDVTAVEEALKALRDDLPSLDLPKFGV